MRPPETMTMSLLPSDRASAEHPVSDVSAVLRSCVLDLTEPAQSRAPMKRPLASPTAGSVPWFATQTWVPSEATASGLINPTVEAALLPRRFFGESAASRPTLALSRRLRALVPADDPSSEPHPSPPATLWIANQNGKRGEGRSNRYSHQHFLARSEVLETPTF